MKRKNNKKKKLTIILLLLVIVGLSVGYALLSTNLNINGTTSINSSNWNVYWDNVQVSSGSVTATTPATINTAKDTVTYEITLNTPGEYYEFTVDAVNAGTLDAMLESVSSKLNNVEITSLPSYLEYSVTYNGGITPTTNSLLAAGSSDQYKVRIGFKKDISVSDLPTTAQTLNMSFKVNYVQADGDSQIEMYYDVLQLNVGDTVSDSLNLKTTPEASMSDSGLPFVLKYDVQGDTITDISIGVSGQNGMYYIKPVTYNSTYTKQNHINELNNGFGGNYCNKVQAMMVDCSLDSVSLHFDQGGDNLYVSDKNNSQNYVILNRDGETTVNINR